MHNQLSPFYGPATGCTYLGLPWLLLDLAVTKLFRTYRARAENATSENDKGEAERWHFDEGHTVNMFDCVCC